MYKIIGGDRQEYGPVTEADLRKWIEEGRLNGQSLAKGENDADFRPLSTFPEFAGALGTAAAYGAAPSSAQGTEWKSRDAELDIAGCISRGWNLFVNNLGTIWGSAALWLVLSFFVFGVVSGIAGAIANAFSVETRVSAPFLIVQTCLTNIVTSLVIGPLSGGLYYVFIETIRGRTPGVGHLFIGFQKAYLQLFIGKCVVVFATGLCFLPATIIMMPKLAPMLELSQQAKGGATPEQAQEMIRQMISAYTSSIPIFLISMVPMFYIFTGFLFTLPLIIDKGMDFWTAIKTSWRMVHKHFAVFGLVFLVWLFNIVGFCLCCIPVFFTFAFTTAACMFAYETIFGDSRQV